MPVYIVETAEQLQGLIFALTQDFQNQFKLNVCKYSHRKKYCCKEFLHLMHYGHYPNYSVIYIADHLEFCMKVILNHLITHYDHCDIIKDVDNFMLCPSTDFPFAEQ